MGPQVLINESWYNTSCSDLLRFVEERLEENVAGLVLFAHRGAFDRRQELAKLFFTVEYDCSEAIQNPLNFFRRKLNLVLTNYANYAIRFEDKKHKKLIILPMRNFNSDAFLALTTVCTIDTDQKEFRNRLDDALKVVRNLQKPKRFEDNKDQYVIDAEGKYFQYGNEKHAQADTKEPPHNIACRLANLFRFGRRFDSDRHFNVSLDGKRISGSFPDCHGAMVEVTKHGQPTALTHINMFSNDFF